MVNHFVDTFAAYNFEVKRITKFNGKDVADRLIKELGRSCELSSDDHSPDTSKIATIHGLIEGQDITIVLTSTQYSLIAKDLKGSLHVAIRRVAESLRSLGLLSHMKSADLVLSGYYIPSINNPDPSKPDAVLALAKLLAPQRADTSWPVSNFNITLALGPEGKTLKVVEYTRARNAEIDKYALSVEIKYRLFSEEQSGPRVDLEKVFLALEKIDVLHQLEIEGEFFEGLEKV